MLAVAVGLDSFFGWRLGIRIAAVFVFTLAVAEPKNLARGLEKQLVTVFLLDFGAVFRVPSFLGDELPPAAAV